MGSSRYSLISINYLWSVSTWRCWGSNAFAPSLMCLQQLRRDLLQSLNLFFVSVPSWVPRSVGSVVGMTWRTKSAALSSAAELGHVLRVLSPTAAPRDVAHRWMLFPCRKPWDFLHTWTGHRHLLALTLFLLALAVHCSLGFWLWIHPFNSAVVDKAVWELGQLCTMNSLLFPSIKHEALGKAGGYSHAVEQ